MKKNHKCPFCKGKGKVSRRHRGDLAAKMHIAETLKAKGYKPETIVEFLLIVDPQVPKPHTFRDMVSQNFDGRDIDLTDPIAGVNFK